MNTLTHHRNRLDLNFIPHSLTAWVEPVLLVKLTYEAVTSLAGFDRLAAEEGGDAVTRSKMMLVLLTYSYATGSYASQEIEEKSQEPGVLNYLSANQPLNSDDLRHFRRRWRQVVQACLVILFQAAWRIHLGGHTELRGDPWRPAECADSSVYSNLGPLRLFVCEAETRIVRAAQLDSMEWDI